MQFAAKVVELAISPKVRNIRIHTVKDSLQHLHLHHEFVVAV